VADQAAAVVGAWGELVASCTRAASKTIGATRAHDTAVARDAQPEQCEHAPKHLAPGGGLVAARFNVLVDEAAVQLARAGDSAVAGHPRVDSLQMAGQGDDGGKSGISVTPAARASCSYSKRDGTRSPRAT